MPRRLIEGNVRARKIGALSAALLAVLVGLVGVAIAQEAPKAKKRERRAGPKLSEVVERSMSSVVLIKTKDSKGDDAGKASGFVVTKEGLIATNYHVISGASSATVQFQDEKEIEVQGVRAIDVEGDLAVLQIAALPDGVAPLELAGRVAPKRGAEVIALGNPQGLKFTATTGIVSAAHRTDKLPEELREHLQARDDFVWIQTSAAISPGNSGGPLLDAAGTVIGVNSWGAGGENLGFAAHAAHVGELLAKLDEQPTSLAKLAEPEEKLEKLLKELYGEEAGFFRMMRGMRMRKIHRSHGEENPEVAEQFLKLAEEYPKTPTSLSALGHAVSAVSGADSPSKRAKQIQRRAAEKLLADFGADSRGRRMVLSFAFSGHSGAEPFLRTLIDNATDKPLQTLATIGLIGALYDDESVDGPKHEEIGRLMSRLDASAEKLKVAGFPLARLIEPIKTKLPLLVGQTPPELKGKDLNGKQFSLSDYVGRPVLVSFMDREDGSFAERSAFLNTCLSEHASTGLAIVVVQPAKQTLYQPPPEFGRAKNGPPACMVAQDDFKQSIARKWNSQGGFGIFLIDREGKLRHRNLMGWQVVASVWEYICPPPPAVKAERLAGDGVKADKVVIVNQYNSTSKDRGTKKARVEWLLGDKSLSVSPPIGVPWFSDREGVAEVDCPAVRFDRVRIWVDEWEGAGGGLSEVKVMQGDLNLARGCPARASAVYDNQWPAERVTDGDETSDGAAEYWLLPDSRAGWIDVDLTVPYPPRGEGVRADRIVLWNQHNGPDNNAGSRSARVSLWLQGKEVWAKDTAIPWKENTDEKAELALPDVAFDIARVDLEAVENKHPGLAEVQIFRGEENLARGAPVRANSWYNDTYHVANAVDGITSSAKHLTGYWLSEVRCKPFVEIDLGAAYTSAGAAYRARGIELADKGEWDLAAPWLRRCDDRAIREAVRFEAFVHDAPKLLFASGIWWAVARRSEGAERTMALRRAVKLYRKLDEVFDSPTQAMMESRLERALAELPERNQLYFHKPVGFEGMTLYDFRSRSSWLAPPDARHALIVGRTDAGEGIVRYSLDREYRKLKGRAAIVSTAGKLPAPVTMIVRIDGREVWKSKPLSEAGQTEDLEVDIAEGETLELVTVATTTMRGDEAAWLKMELEPAEAGGR